MRLLCLASFLFLAPAASAQIEIGFSLSRLTGSSSEPILLSPQPNDATAAWSAYVVGGRLGYRPIRDVPLLLALRVGYGPSSEIQETAFPSSGSIRRSLSLVTVRPEVAYELYVLPRFSIRAGAYAGFTRASVHDEFDSPINTSEDETVWSGATAGLTSHLIFSLNDVAAVSVGADLAFVRPDFEIVRARTDIADGGTQTFYAPVSFDAVQPQISLLLRL